MTGIAGIISKIDLRLICIKDFMWGPVKAMLNNLISIFTRNRKHFSVVMLTFLMAFTCSLNVQAATSKTNSDKMNIYKKGAEGLNGLKDKAVAFYKKHGFLPNIQQLLSETLDDQSKVTIENSDYFEKHYLGVIGVLPDKIGSCKIIKIEGNINTNEGQGDPYLIYTLITFNIHGAWKTLCSYDERDSKSSPISLDNCYNVADVNQSAQLNEQRQALESLCNSADL